MRTLVKISRAVLALAILLTLSATGLARERKPTKNRQTAPDARAASPTARKAARTGPKRPQTAEELRYEVMSDMGAMASGLIPIPDLARPGERASGTGAVKAPASPATIGSADIIVHGSGDVAFQSETSIASNSTGTVIVAGYNDIRGASLVPVSVSGVARSTDGGVTWNEVVGGHPSGLGLLPSVTGGQVFGDPDVKYDPFNDLFVYSSLYVRPSDGLLGLSIHTSADDGATWSLPIAVTPAFAAGGSADKEFMDINPVTGRILLTWTHFAAGTTIRRTYSDNQGASWAPVVILATNPAGGAVTGSIPRFDPNTDNTDSGVYSVWRTIEGPPFFLRNIGCSRSTDGGATWSAPVAIDTVSYPAEDQIVGVDRVNTNPGLAVNHSTGQAYVVYQRNDLVGTGDIAFRTFLGPCAAGVPTLINSDPGNDRAQFYPSVTVDQATGRVHAMWIDQDPEDTGDLHEMMYSFSTDAGATWSRPTPLLDRPFRAGFGNDTSQPNIGDYNQNIAQNGEHHSLHGATSVAPRFNDGQPTSASLFTPDTYYDVRLDSQDVVSLRHVGTSFTETGCGASDGNIDSSETIDFTFTLENYVGNLVSATTITGISATLSTTTPGVSIGTGTSAYPDIPPLGTAPNTTAFTITVASTFTPGVYIDLLLTVTSAQGTTELPIRLPTGSPGATTTLINEDFQGVTPPALPVGWSTLNGGTAPLDAWVTSTLLTPTNAVFHDNDGAQLEFMRLLSPVVVVPSVGSGVESYVTLDFDIAYRLEDEPTQQVLAYDGLTLRITDQTSGQLIRSVLAEAFAEAIKTGTSNHFPKHLPRLTSVNYFQDMSVWSGDSGGVLHVSMKFPGAGMTGRSIQLRFEYTEDSFGDCTLAGHAAPCGVAIDNIVLRHVVSGLGPCGADLSIAKTDSPDPVNVGATLTYTLQVNNAGPDPANNVVVTDTLPAGTTYVSAMGMGWTCGHLAGVVTCTRTTLAVGPAPPITIQVTAPLAIGSINNMATVAADENDPVSGNNSDSESTSVISPSSVTATKTVAGDFAPGRPITYTVVLSNSGPAAKLDNPGDEFQDVLPSSLTLVSASAPSGTANANVGTNTVTWNGSIPAAGSVTITINATINLLTGGTVISNQGTAFFDADGNGTNESSALTDDPGQPGASDPTQFTVAPGRSFFTVVPCRVLDTRNPSGPYGAPPLVANGDRTFVISGQCNIPTTAKAIAGNVTVTGSTSPIGDLRLRPGGTPLLSTSTINYSLGQTRANNIVIPLGAAGDITVRCAGSPGTVVDFIFDVTGYFE